MLWTIDQIAQVMSSAHGRRDDYRLDPKPLSDEGGQGRVTGGTHKTSGYQIAMKRRRHVDEESAARFRREATIGKALADAPHVMPVLDSDADATWLVMPQADGNLDSSRARIASDSDAIRDLLEAVLKALEAAHKKGWVHRDIKPSNILYSNDSNGDPCWMLADWGLGRPPRGGTTHPGRTAVGASYGTEGFSAPEMSVDAHSATAATDLYSLGQVIGWVVTGQTPLANVPRLPPSGIWRPVVRALTQLAQDSRLQSVEEVRVLIRVELEEDLEPPGRATQLLESYRTGKQDSALALFRLARDHTDEPALFLDILPQLDDDAVTNLVETDQTLAIAVAIGLREHLRSDWESRDFNWANQVIRLALRLATKAAQAAAIDVLEESVDTMFAWDDDWDRWEVQRSISAWLRSLAGENARIVGSSLAR